VERESRGNEVDLGFESRGGEQDDFEALVGDFGGIARGWGFECPRDGSRGQSKPCATSKIC